MSPSLLKFNKHTTTTTTIPILYSTDGSITATFTVTPGVLLPELIGFVHACFMLDADPAGDVIVAVWTSDSSAQGMLFICKITTLLQT